MNQKHHFLHYSVLFLVLAVAVALFCVFSYSHIYQFIIIIAASLSYIAWGIIHHAIEDRLEVGIILEYVLIGLVVIAGFWVTLLR